ncbi:MAG: methyltransferase domain-containing protein, partial [Deltaproteobacteria bacterium]|nr:methyltransferase domain-containing protein [Deltaproteobacteria bacterium]
MKTYNGKGIPPLKKKLNNINWKNLQRLPLVRLCAGDIPEKKEYDGQIGLSLTRSDHRHIKHDICKPLPMPDNSVDSYQAEDVFEHIEYDKLLPIINEIYRVLKPNATFRLSVPDYGCDVLIDRSEKNTLGNIVFDPGGEIPNEPGHLWFPRIDKVKQLLEKSAFGKFGKIEYLHFYNMDGTFVVNKIDYSKGHIQ